MIGAPASEGMISLVCLVSLALAFVAGLIVVYYTIGAGGADEL